MSTELTVPDAQVEIFLLQADVSTMNEIDVVTRMTNAGLPQEVITRIRELWDVTREVAGQTIEVGKVILSEVLKFIDENPHLAIGAAMGAAVGSLINLLPFLGSMLMPLFMVLGAFIGGVAGARLDRNGVPGEGFFGIAQEIISVAKKFFDLLVAVFTALRDQLFTEE